MAVRHGNIEEFDINSQNWDEYIERLEHYFVANTVDDDAIKRSILLTVCGSKTYGLIRNVVSPEKPSDKTYDELKTAIGTHLKPKPLVIAERFKFHQRKQREGETVSQFLAELRKLSEHCNFEGFLNDAIRDRFVCGLSSTATQRKLLSESDLTLKRAMDIAISMEMADSESRKLKETVFDDGKNAERTHKVFTQCFRCGKNNHNADNCYYKNSKCHKCHENGHLSKMCHVNKSRQNVNKPRSHQSTESTGGTPGNKKRHKMKKKSPKVNFVDSDMDSSGVQDTEQQYSWPLFSINSGGHKEINIDLLIDNKQQKMELDTGASVSLMSEKEYKQKYDGKLNKSSTVLRTYNGQLLPVVGEKSVTVQYGDQHLSLPLLVVKADGPALLGRNWLSQLKLNWQSIKYTIHDNLEKEIFQRYKVFNEELGTVKGVTATLRLKDNCTPKFFKPRPVPFALKDKIGEELERLEKAGILRKVESSDWGTPIVPVLKPDGSVRICGDYKVTINPYLDVPEYPLPTSEELFAKLNGGEQFSKLDLTSAYQQVLLDEESRNLVTINTHQGLYQYTRLPFGVAAAPAIFQRTMDQVLQGIEGVGCILDDILITGKSDVEHCHNLHTTLQRLENFGIRLRKDKCFFLRDEVEYFAFKVNKEGIHPSPRKVEAILKLADPQNKRELQSWLGIVNYYRKFIPNMATVLEPLTHLLANDVEWQWSQTCANACETIKKLLVSSEVMVHYDPKKPLTLAVDASSYGLGAVISHTIGSNDKPIAYVSRTLTSAERNYSQIEKEALAIIFGIQRFHQYLYGRRFTLLTDHKPLTTILGPKKGIPVLAASRLQRWAIQLSAYQFDIKFRSTDKNGNADVLSRFPMKEEESGVDDNYVFYEEAQLVNKMQVNSLPVTAMRIAAATKGDTTLARVIEFTRSGWPNVEMGDELKPYHRIRDELTMEEGCLLRGVRVIIPNQYQSEILDELHSNHPGIVRMKSLARLHAWWPNMDVDIERKVSGCEACQKVLPNAPKSPANPWRWPSAPWNRIHIDFAGPFMSEMFMVVVDAHSKWLDVIRMSSTTTASTINALRFLFASYGLPKELVSDNGPQFTAAEFATFLKENGVRHILSAPYHPSSNGEAERAVRTFKQAMKSLVQSDSSLNQKLASFLLSYRTTPHSLTKTPPSELFLGRKLRTRLDIMRPDLSGKIQQKTTPTESKTRLFEIGDIVITRDYRGNPRKPSYIKGIVIRKLGPMTYTIQVDNLIWKRHVDQIRTCDPACNFEPREQAVPDTHNSLDSLPGILPNPTIGTQRIPSADCPIRIQTSEVATTTPETDQTDPSTNVTHEHRYPRRDIIKPSRLIENC
ncbi:uncharacterized protein K02A2.6-like [Pecten maximus]|uniref:uncharacterized protein K02A2.6-like n=1 Tax=Pecten maximus TaxID=6579 RepID=UPI001457EA39|nr:uncharacterized protein K02A2.6-like [Pecten maximus]